jgi:hypothetical protein
MSSFFLPKGSLFLNLTNITNPFYKQTCETEKWGRPISAGPFSAGCGGRIPAGGFRRVAAGIALYLTERLGPELNG